MKNGLGGYRPQARKPAASPSPFGPMEIISREPYAKRWLTDLVTDALEQRVRNTGLTARVVTTPA